MNPSGNQNPGQFTQNNSPRRGGNVYANQGTGNQIIHTGPGKRGGGDTKALLVTLALDAVFFLYGMLSYTGRNTFPATDGTPDLPDPAHRDRGHDQALVAPPCLKSG